MNSTVTTLSTYRERKLVGDAHEDRVQTELRSRGWTVDPYGQALLSEPTRRALSCTESRMRWDPDMVASLGSTVCLIDAKGSVFGEDIHTIRISRKAVEAGRRLAVDTDLPLYYVFANLGVATPFEVMDFVHLRSLGKSGAYISFGSGLLRPFDDVFGTPGGFSGLAAA